MRIELQTNQRGYILMLEKDLFGDYVLSRYWYGLSNRRYGKKCQVFREEQQALDEFCRVQKLRERRGYAPVKAPI